jgi:hypothetical protein
MAAELPAFIFFTPAGFHVRDFDAFAESGLMAPVSANQEKFVQNPYIFTES